ncbi:MAG TPA: glucosaminidase domain-containing protein [Vicinamibacteria bacterium]|nr:glucosaminidase domain-containing protein [Vicinamibacteria bacterium]HRB11830.1 glucosaminidase domain-containing protein [Vicinamibacteria bacterium]
MRRQLRLLAALLATILAVACGSNPTSPSPSGGPSAGLPSVPVMGSARLSASQLVAWFTRRQPQPAGIYGATEPVEALAAYFIDEGAREGVAGDVAFVQSIIETGWFRFSGSVPGWKNNFAGIGAVDGSPGDAASFPDARTGVRAQIQHLRAYADPSATSCTIPPLHAPCVDPRFALVTPKGRAPLWNQFGGGVWASSSTYGSDIVARYQEALAFNGLSF